MNKSIFLSVLSVLFLLSCKKENEQVNVVFLIKPSAEITENGRSYDLDISQTRILFSNFKLIDAAGKETIVKDVFLYKTNGSNGFSFEYPKGNYSSFKFYFGLDKNTNNAVPASFPASHPLSVENGLYWDMLKYRFLIVEGKIDNSPGKDQVPASPFSMHLGTDTLYNEINVSSVPLSGNTIQIEMDFDKLFILDADPFQITNFSNHCSDLSEVTRAIEIKNSFVSGIKTTVLIPE